MLSQNGFGWRLGEERLLAIERFGERSHLFLLLLTAFFTCVK